ncbi:uncharacterized protein J3R85_020680 [Psidium guajava]|nr:uncharacterized protein J3R85_020680 [Psidium guajava]
MSRWGEIGTGGFVAGVPRDSSGGPLLDGFARKIRAWSPEHAEALCHGGSCSRRRERWRSRRKQIVLRMCERSVEKRLLRGRPRSAW